MHSTASQWIHKEHVVNGVRLHYVDAGEGPLVILLHGFPDFWYTWRAQIPTLVEAGYRVIAPDMRGYHVSDKPRRRADYRIDKLVGDVKGLINRAGARKATLVGHDWGGVVAWNAAILRPAMVERLAILNAPHPTDFTRKLRTSRQALRSWYIFAFQLPWLPEKAMAAARFALLEKVLKQEAVNPNAFTDADIAEYKRALGRPGALTAMINYYRAAFDPRSIGRNLGGGHVDVPTLVLWGEQDRHLDITLTEDLDRWVPDLRVDRFRDAGHWVHRDVPERVNRRLLEFLAETPATSDAAEQTPA